LEVQNGSYVLILKTGQQTSNPVDVHPPDDTLDLATRAPSIASAENPNEEDAVRDPLSLRRSTFVPYEPQPFEHAAEAKPSSSSWRMRIQVGSRVRRAVSPTIACF
jgi:hypothetical protein